MNSRKLPPAAVAAGAGAGLIALCAASLLYAVHVPAELLGDAPATRFSAARAMLHVQQVSKQAFPSARLRSNAARAYIIEQLRMLGLAPLVQSTIGVGTRYAVAGPVSNVLARLPGRTPGGPAVLLMAHLDAVPASPGAGDDGSGTAVLLETLRALRASPPLDHDVIALFTDAEESGLLGAAAFVREHPWARDVAVVLNFEARGTSGPSLMFETGPGNLDVVRELRRVAGVRATSLSTAVYRRLPNDTDLSDLALLGLPAMNFAFIGGVERYHTAEDDIWHLDPRSVQQHGNQALALARIFGNGPLPRPRTTDAVFFNVPLLGLVVYPESLAVVFAVVALALVAMMLAPGRAPEARLRMRDVAIGVGLTIVAAATATVAAILVAVLLRKAHGAWPGGGQPEWSGVYAAAVALLAFAIAAAVRGVARGLARGVPGGLFAGVLLFWALLSVMVSVAMPGASFLFTWPVLVMTLAGLSGRRWPGRVATAGSWIAAAIVVFIVVPVVYLMACTALGLGPTGAAVVGAFTGLTTCLLWPQVDAMGRSGGGGGGGGDRPTMVPLVAAGASLVLFAIGAMTVRTSAEHPGGAALVYAVDADSNKAWLTGYARGGASRAALLGVLDSVASGQKSAGGGGGDGGGNSDSAPASAPAWVGRPFGAHSIVRVPVLAVPPPSAAVLSDTTNGAERTVSLRITPGAGSRATVLSLEAGVVLDAAVDGKPIDTWRYRVRPRAWTLEYASPPDSGFALTLRLRAGGRPVLALRAIAPGVPPVPEFHLPRRPAHILPIQNGDMTWVYRRVPL